MNEGIGPLALAGRRCARLVRRFKADRRGGTGVQAMAMMPLIIIASFTLFKMWEVVQVRESLHTGTYEAARYLSLYPPADARLELWDQIAGRIIENELRSNPWVDPIVFIGDANNPVGLKVTAIWGPEEYDCRMTFTIAADLTYRLPNPPKFRGLSPFPSAGFVLHENRKGEILCK